MSGIIYRAATATVTIAIDLGAGLDFFVFLHFDLYLQLHLI